MAHGTRSKAARALQRLEGTQAELAERFGVARFTLVRWLNGTSVPNPKTRRAIEDAGGPPARDWDELVPESAPPEAVTSPHRPSPGASSDTDATAETTRAQANRFYRIVEAELEALETDMDLEAGKRLSRIESLAGVVVQLGKLTGAAGLDERKIVASPAWRRITARIADALAPWPEALEAVANAMGSADA